MDDESWGATQTLPNPPSAGNLANASDDDRGILKRLAATSHNGSERNLLGAYPLDP